MGNGRLLASVLGWQAECGSVQRPTIAASGRPRWSRELKLGTTSLALLDIDIAYRSYTYRVIAEPQEQHKFELIVPWVFGN
jgi:hypothetical protein